MKSFENSEQIIEKEKKFSFENRNKLRENIFDDIIAKKLLDNVFESMDNSDYEEDEISQVSEVLASLSHEDLKCILSIPLESRDRFYSTLKREVSSKKTTFRQEIFDKLLILRKEGYCLGYHVSNFEIPPKVSKEGVLEWNIIGSDDDHRDEIDEYDKKPMAYYSLDYKNFYRKKGGNFIYIVRAQTGNDTAHRRDLSNNWGRALTLSIVDKLNIADVDREVERILKEKNPER